MVKIMKDKRLYIIIMIWVLIGVLIIAGIAIRNKANVFERDCIETFDINDDCPCNPFTSSPKISIEYEDFNFSKIEVTKP